jgi:hypothetical protein
LNTGVGEPVQYLLALEAEACIDGKKYGERESANNLASSSAKSK